MGEGDGWVRRRFIGDLPEDLLKSAAGVLILIAWESSKLVWSKFSMGLTDIIIKLFIGSVLKGL